ncbi:MGMT family protein [Actinomyces provencensis]|uniref:MGMT family protein n=1 Tax=Actinomyces provencensis TaxID=1720198 RepID=UPI00096A8001|nr:MGMT family protein [Actinomyces provencensis]
MDDVLVERVLRAVECVPASRLVTYGDIATLVGTGPRQVGAVMALWGGGVAWWRVVSARGALPGHLLVRARAHWVEEGVALPGEEGRAALVHHRMDPADLREAYRAATADLPPEPSPPVA